MSHNIKFVLGIDTDESNKKLQAFTERLRDTFKSGELSISQLKEAQKSLDAAFEDTFDSKLRTSIKTVQLDVERLSAKMHDGATSFAQIKHGFNDAFTGLRTGNFDLMASGVGSLTTKLGPLIASGGVVVSVLGNAASAGLDLNRSMALMESSVSSAEEEFGDIIGTSSAWSRSIDDLSESLLLYSRGALADAVSKTIDMTKRQGLSEEQMVTLILRTGEMAAGKMGLSEAIERTTAAIRGEAEGAEALGLTLSESYMASNLASIGINKQWKEMTELEKSQARYRMLLEQTNSAQGRASEYARSTAGQIEVLSRKYENAKTSIGLFLLKIVDSIGVLEALGGASTRTGVSVTVLGQNVRSTNSGFVGLQASIEGVLLAYQKMDEVAQNSARNQIKATIEVASAKKAELNALIATKEQDLRNRSGLPGFSDSMFNALTREISALKAARDGFEQVYLANRESLARILSARRAEPKSVQVTPKGKAEDKSGQSSIAPTPSGKQVSQKDKLTEEIAEIRTALSDLEARQSLPEIALRGSEYMEARLAVLKSGLRSLSDIGIQVSDARIAGFRQETLALERVIEAEKERLKQVEMATKIQPVVVDEISRQPLSNVRDIAGVEAVAIPDVVVTRWARVIESAEHYQGIMVSASSLANNLYEMQRVNIERLMDVELKAANIKIDNEERQALAVVQTEQEKESVRAQYAEKRSRAELDAQTQAKERARGWFMATQAASAAEAAINTALAVTNALATTKPAVLAPIAAVAIGASGAAQVASILSKPIPAFATGGLVEGGRQIIQVNEFGREFVVNAQATERYGGLLSQINTGQAPTVHVDLLPLVREIESLKRVLLSSPVVARIPRSETAAIVTIGDQLVRNRVL